jgi:predicted RNase H-like HicB family nuclease
VTVRYYPAIVERAGDGGYGVYFPDLDGCTSGGDTLQEAARNAAEALALHLEGMAEESYPIPDPSDLDALPVPEPGEAARLLVPGDVPGRSVRANLSLEEGLLARIDAAATARGMSRSAFVAEAARRMMAGTEATA